MSSKEYSRGELAKAIQVDAQTIHFWTIRGIIIPNIAISHRPGLHRKYDEMNLMECKFIISLRNFNFTLEEIKRILHLIRIFNKTEPNFYTNKEIKLAYNWWTTNDYGIIDEIVYDDGNIYIPHNAVIYKTVKLSYFRDLIYGREW